VIQQCFHDASVPNITMAMQDLNVKQCDRVKKNFIKAIGDEIDYRFFKRAIEQQNAEHCHTHICA
jgi:hypothetical protein